MKYIILILCLIANLSANIFVCHIDKQYNMRKQVQACKMAIIKHECEKQGLQVWSSTEVKNNTLTHDKVQSIAQCNDINIHVDNVSIQGNDMKVSYRPTNTNQTVTAVSMDQWTDIDGVASKNIAGTATIINKDSSSTIVNASGSIQVDSKPIVDQYKIWKEKGKRILKIITE